MSRTSPFRIGYVDYQLENFHANIYLKMIRDELSARGFEVGGAWAMEQDSGRQWCTENGVPAFATLDEMDPHVDGYLILAPANPEHHLELCQQVFPYGKPTFVDKTFAPDLETAVEIFHLADQYRIAVQTTSALRTTAIQRVANSWERPVETMHVFAGGPSWDEYGIHPIELVVSCMGADATRLLRLSDSSKLFFVIQFAENRMATIDFQRDHVPFRALIAAGDQVEHIVVDDQRLFLDALSAILDFFEAGQALVDRAESLLVRRILDVATLEEANGAFVSLI